MLERLRKACRDPKAGRGRPKAVRQCEPGWQGRRENTAGLRRNPSEVSSEPREIGLRSGSDPPPETGIASGSIQTCVIRVRSPGEPSLPLQARLTAASGSSARVGVHRSPIRNPSRPIGGGPLPGRSRDRLPFAVGPPIEPRELAARGRAARAGAGDGRRTNDPKRSPIAMENELPPRDPPPLARDGR